MNKIATDVAQTVAIYVVGCVALNTVRSLSQKRAEKKADQLQRDLDSFYSNVENGNFVSTTITI